VPVQCRSGSGSSLGQTHILDAILEREGRTSTFFTVIRRALETPLVVGVRCHSPSRALARRGRGKLPALAKLD